MMSLPRFHHPNLTFPETMDMRRTKVVSHLGPLLPAFSLLLFLLAGQPFDTQVNAQAPGAGQGAFFCRYYGTKDAHPITYVTPVFVAAMTENLQQKFYAYMQSKYDLSKILQGTGGCRQLSSNPAAQANSMKMFEQQWAVNKTEVIRVPWTDSASDAASDSAAGPGAAAPSAGAAAPPGPQQSPARPGMPWIACSTSGGAGIDTYYTGVFQTAKPVRHLPSGGNLVDQSVLDDFYAWLTQKGYKFKPGSNYGCDVAPTEAAAKAAHHKRAYEGGGCSTCGKIVETGWTE
jgi:hypothetical protein